MTFRMDEYTAVEQPAEAFTNILFSSGTTGMITPPPNPHPTKEKDKKGKGKENQTQKRKKERKKEGHADDYNLMNFGSILADWYKLNPSTREI